MNSNKLSRDESVMMVLEAEARRIYAEWAYKRLELHGERFEKLPSLADPTVAAELDALLPWSESLPLRCRVFKK